MGFDEEILGGLTKADGTPRTLLDVSRLRSLVWDSRNAHTTDISMACGSDRINP